MSDAPREYEFDDLYKTPKQKIEELLAEHKGMKYVWNTMIRWCNEYDRYRGQPTPVLCTDNALEGINEEMDDESNEYNYHVRKKYDIPRLVDIPGDVDKAEKEYHRRMKIAWEKDKDTPEGLRHARKMRILFRKRDEEIARMKAERDSKDKK